MAIPPLDTATPDEILLAVRARLNELVTGATEENTWLPFDANADPALYPGDFGFAIAAYSGNFPAGMFEGGGGHQATCDSGFAIAIWSSVRMDEPRRETEFLTNETLGIWQKATEVLSAICGANGWRPSRKNDYLTRDCVFPAGFQIIRSSNRLAGVRLDFAVSFDWRLGGPVNG